MIVIAKQALRTIDGKRRRFYLGVKGSEKLQKYVGNCFRKERLAILRSNKKCLERFIRDYEDYSVSSVYARMPGAFAELPKESFVDDRFKELWDWAHEDYKRNPKPFSRSVNIACDGTRVRSKGECVLYNECTAACLPFRYDGLLELWDERGRLCEFYPDIQIQCYNTKLIIIEHLGMLDDPDYAATVAKKLRVYLHNGFILGKNLFLTSDDKDGGLDSEVTERLIETIKEMFYCGDDGK